MSDIKSEGERGDFRRSMSENCIDQYEERPDSEMNNGSSNDSIVFVFMGNSHSKDSMEQLKSFTSRQPGYKVEVGSSQEILEADSDDDTGSSSSEENMHNGSMETVETVKENMIPAEERISSESLQKEYEDDDDKPLRHRYGIDESVLPIPTKSVSCDNIPKQSWTDRDIHRSRSASLLDVGQIDNANDPKNNEGIFPPCVETSERGSNDTSSIQEHHMSSIDACNTSESMMSSIEEAMIIPLEVNREEVTYSRIPLGSSPSDEGNSFITEPKLFKSPTISQERYRAPIMVDKAMETSKEGLTETVQEKSNQQPTEASTQTGTDESSIKDANTAPRDASVLPSLDSPYRAKSIGDVSQPARDTELNLSEEADNWLNLSSMVNETSAMIQNIQDKSHDGHQNPGTNHDRSTNLIHQSRGNNPTEVQDDVTQTGSSLLDLHTSECQNG